MAKFISWAVCARASTSLREESILPQPRADETPADGVFVNRSFFRGMDVTILAQKTLLYCAHATRHPWCPAVPTRQDQDSRLLDPACNSPSLRDTGRRGTRLWPLRGSHVGTAATPAAVGPTWRGPTMSRHSGERNARHGQLLTIIAAGPSPPTPFPENETQKQRTK